MTSLALVHLNKTAAVEWLRTSLGQGDIFSAAVLASVPLHHGHSWVLAPPDQDPQRLAALDQGGVGITADIDQRLEQVCAALINAGGRCLLVEDDLARRHDRHVRASPFPAAFAKERVIHWTALADDSSQVAARQLIKIGASGYPLNAFVSAHTPKALGLADRSQVSPTTADLVVRTLVAIVVAAYDAESYLVWRPAPEIDTPFTRHSDRP